MVTYRLTHPTYSSHNMPYTVTHLFDLTRADLEHYIRRTPRHYLLVSLIDRIGSFEEWDIKRTETR